MQRLSRNIEDKSTDTLACDAAPQLDALLALADYRPTWHALAACRGAGPDLFYVGQGGDLSPARELCESCPVIERCARQAEHEPFGFWAGQSERQRKQARRGAA